MKIYTQKLLDFSNKVNIIICQYEAQKKILHDERIKLTVNTALEEVIARMAATEKEMENQIVVLTQMKMALNKISQMYSQGEEKIKSEIDCSWSVDKHKFVSFSDVNVDTDFSWRVK